MEGSFPTWLRANCSKLVSRSVANDSPLSLQEFHNCPKQFTDPLFYGHISEGGVGGWQSGISNARRTIFTLDRRSSPGGNLIGFCTPKEPLCWQKPTQELRWGGGSVSEQKEHWTGSQKLPSKPLTTIPVLPEQATASRSSSSSTSTPAIRLDTSLLLSEGPTEWWATGTACATDGSQYPGYNLKQNG